LWVAVVPALCVLAQALALAPSRAEASARAHIAVLSHGSWSWFADPRAVQLGNKVFVGWIDWRGEIKIVAYDPEFGTLGTYTLAYLFHDDHGRPVDPRRAGPSPDRLLVGPQRLAPLLPDEQETRGYPPMGAHQARRLAPSRHPRLQLSEPGAAPR
jgi:hypothetical protein